MVDVRPGTHLVVSSRGGDLRLTASADSVYFVKVWWKRFAWKGHTKMKGVGPAEARPIIAFERRLPTGATATP